MGDPALDEDARDLFKSIAKGGKVVPMEAFKTALGEMMGTELTPSAKENLNDILSTIATIIDADESGTITEDEFAASANLFVTIANGSSPFDNPDIFFDLLDTDRSGSVSVKELTKIFTTLLPKATDQSIIKSIVDDIMTAAGTSESGELSRAQVRAIADKLKTMFGR